MRSIACQTSQRSCARGALPFLAVIAFAGAGCRIGGPTWEPDTVSDASVGLTSADGAAESTTGQTQNPPTGTDGGSSAGDTGTASGEDGGGSGVDAALPDGGQPIVDSGGGNFGDGACSPTAATTVCDPVCNTGCTGLTRCDVADNVTLTGACIGIWIDGVGTGCIKTASTDPCAVNLACVSGVCQKLCWHDSECVGVTGATCCKAPVDATGFKYCAACGP